MEKSHDELIEKLFSLPPARIYDRSYFSMLDETRGWMASNRIKRATVERKSRLALKKTDIYELKLAINYVETWITHIQACGMPLY